MTSFSFAPTGYDNHVPGSMGIFGMGYTSGSVSDSEQEQLSGHFGPNNEFRPTWHSSATGGISSTPMANQPITHHYMVDVGHRHERDVLKDELIWNVNVNSGRQQGDIPQYHLGLSALRRDVKQGGSLYNEFVNYQSSWYIPNKVAFLGVQVTTPQHTTPGLSTPMKRKKNETVITAKIARTKDIWAVPNRADLPIEPQLAVTAGTYLYIAWNRYLDPITPVYGAWGDQLIQARMQDQTFHWLPHPVASAIAIPPSLTYTNRFGDEFESYGHCTLIGWVRTQLDQFDDEKNFAYYSDKYLNAKDGGVALEAFTQLRSIQINVRR